jgi:hypothetical protein
MFFISILILLTNGLGAAVAYPGGYADGKIIALRHNQAFLMINTSRPDGKSDKRLLAVDLIKRVIKWETVPLGYISNVIEVNYDRFIDIEGNHLVSRQAQKGEIIWDLDLQSIATTEADRMPDDPSDHKYGRCFPAPIKEDSFDYSIFKSSPGKIFIFRTESTSEVRPSNEDWLEIDLGSGKLIRKGCYGLCGFSRKSAVIYDVALPRPVIYRINGDAVVLEPQGRSPELDKELSPRPWINFISGPEWFLMDLTSGSFEKSLVVFDDGHTLPLLGLDHPDYYLKYGELKENLLRFTSSKKTDKKPKQGKYVFKVEIMDVEGQTLAKAEQSFEKKFWAISLGQGENCEIFMLIDNQVNVFSYPELKKIMTFSIPKDDFSAVDYFSRNGKLISIGYYKYLLGHVKGNVWHCEGCMKSKKEKTTLTFKFINFPDEKGFWSLKQKVTYYRIKNRDK